MNVSLKPFANIDDTLEYGVGVLDRIYAGTVTGLLILECLTDCVYFSGSRES